MNSNLMISKFLTKFGLSAETVRDPAFQHMIFSINNNFKTPPPAEIEKCLDNFSNMILTKKQDDDAIRSIQPIAVTVDTVENGQDTFLAFSFHYFVKKGTKSHVVHLKKIEALELDEIFNEIRTAANQFNSEQIRFLTIITANPKISLHCVQNNISDRTYICYFTYITFFADTVLNIMEFKNAVEYLQKFYLVVKYDKQCRFEIDKFFKSAGKTYEFPVKLELETWTDVAEFLSDVMRNHHLIINISRRLNKYHKIRKIEFHYQQLICLQEILQHLYESVGELSKLNGYFSQILPEISKIRKVIKLCCPDLLIRMKIENAFMKHLDFITKDFKNREYALATFLDPRFCFDLEIFDHEFWRLAVITVGRKLMSNESGMNLGYAYQCQEKIINKEITSYLNSLENRKSIIDPLLWWNDNSFKFPTLFQLVKLFLPIPACSIDAKQYFGNNGRFMRNHENMTKTEFDRTLLVASSMEVFRGRGYSKNCSNNYNDNELGTVTIPVLRKRKTDREEENCDDFEVQEHEKLDLTQFLMKQPEIKSEHLEEDVPGPSSSNIKEELIEISSEIKPELFDFSIPSTSNQGSEQNQQEDFKTHQVPIQKPPIERVLARSTSAPIKYNSTRVFSSPKKEVEAIPPKKKFSKQILQPQLECDLKFKRTSLNVFSNEGILTKQLIAPISIPKTWGAIKFGKPQNIRDQSKNNE